LLPRKTKEVDPAAEAKARDPSSKVITAAQRKHANKLLNNVASLVSELEQDISEGEGDEYGDELPPSLIPKSKIELASAKGLLEAITLVLAEGWRGNCKEELAKVASPLKIASAQQQKLSKLLKAAALELESASLAE
jgi:hypothetical protein